MTKRRTSGPLRKVSTLVSNSWCSLTITRWSARRCGGATRGSGPEYRRSRLYRRLCCCGYFEAIAFTSDDRERADQYQVNAARVQALGAATDLSSYFASLNMRAICRQFDSVGRPRIKQLINKTTSLTDGASLPSLRSIEFENAISDNRARPVD